MATRIPQIDLAIETQSWNSIALADGTNGRSALIALIETAIAATIKHAALEFPQDAELSVLCINDAAMAELNKKWRGLDKPTNVLSFPANPIQPGETAGQMLGDIVLAFETLEQEALQQNIALSDHLTHLVIHGFLHLFGYDHENDTDAHKMESLETAVLVKLGLANPYE